MDGNTSFTLAINRLVLGLVMAVLFTAGGIAYASDQAQFHTIQIASFEDRANAERYFKELSGILPEHIHGLLRIEHVGRFEALRIGDFPDRASAEEIIPLLEKHGLEWRLLLAPVKDKRITHRPKVRLYAQAQENRDSLAPVATEKIPEKPLGVAHQATPGIRPPGDEQAEANKRLHILETAEHLLKQTGADPERPGRLLAFFMGLDCSNLKVTKAALDNLQALAPRNPGAKKGWIYAQAGATTPGTARTTVFLIETRSVLAWSGT